MQRTCRMLRLGSPFLLVLAAVACERSVPPEDIPIGTDVTVEMQDGRHVTGALVSVDPGTVVVSGARTDGKIWVTRSNVADVRSEENSVVQPLLREAIVPRGTTFNARLETGLASDSSRVEELVRATLTEPLVADGVIVVPAGSTLLGSVTMARESGRVRGRAALGLRFDRLQTDGVIYDIGTVPMRWTARATKRQDAAKVGIGAAAGAVIGAIAGGGKGAAIGSAVGAGGGSAVVLATKGEEIRLGSGTRLRVELTEPMSVMAPADDE